MAGRTTRAMAVALGLASCGLAAATSAAADDKPLPPPEPGSAPAAPGVAKAALSNWQPVFTAFVVPAHGFARSQASCPLGTVPLGGGVQAISTTATVAASVPFKAGNGWIGIVNNPSAGSILAIVEAVCATQPKKWKIVSATYDALPNAQTVGKTAACLDGRQPLSGGAAFVQASLGRSINSSIPQGTTWRVDANNATPIPTKVTVYAVCAIVDFRAVVLSDPVSNPPGLSPFASASCPPNTKPVGGGAYSGSGSPLVAMNTTRSTVSGGTDRWSIREYNGTAAVTASARAYVVCAA